MCMTVYHRVGQKFQGGYYMYQDQVILSLAFFMAKTNPKNFDVFLHCFSGPLGLFRLVFRLRIKNESKFSGRLSLVGLRCFRSPLASIFESQPLALVNGSADKLVVVLVDDVDLPDGADQGARGDESGMGEVSTDGLQGKKSRIFSEKNHTKVNYSFSSS